MRVFLALTILITLLAGCANRAPAPIRTAPTTDLTLTTVRTDIGRHSGVDIRWGGTIARIDNTATETRMEIVERPLDSSGRPRETDRSGGRFLAVVPGFLDPALFAVNRELTVSGKLTGSETRPVGTYPYRFPVVQVTSHHLWPVRQPPPPMEPWMYPWPPFHHPHPWPHRHLP